MFNNSSKIMFSSMLIFSTIITISSNSWLSAWLGLEINLLSFIPLMSDTNLMSTEASLKYFLTQALASSILLFSFILMMIYENFYVVNYTHAPSKLNLTSLMIFSSLLLKTGAAPFHFWFPNIIEGLSWMNCFILMTWQKIAPLMLMSYLINNFLSIMCSILSVMFGALGGLNQSMMRKLMAYSSINHLGWMICSLMYNQNMWMLYFLFYMFLTFNMTYFFNIYKIFNINKMFSLFMNSKMMKFILMFNFLSLGGLPPFLGFIPKWMLIQTMTINNQLFLMFFMIMFSLITIFFYLRICYSGFMINNYELNWMNLNQNNTFMTNMYMLSSSLSIFGLPLISLIYLMF